MPRRPGTESARAVSGTHVARGDSGRGFGLAGRTRASDGENTGMRTNGFGNRLFYRDLLLFTIKHYYQYCVRLPNGVRQTMCYITTM